MDLVSTCITIVV